MTHPTSTTATVAARIFITGGAIVSPDPDVGDLSCGDVLITGTDITAIDRGWDWSASEIASWWSSISTSRARRRDVAGRPVQTSRLMTGTPLCSFRQALRGCRSRMSRRSTVVA